MRKKIQKTFLLVLVLLMFACTITPNPTDAPPQASETLETPVVTPTLTPSPVPPRVLTICMGSEPGSLFLYGDSSVAARSLRQAIYDGPFDVIAFDLSPVIIEKMPTLADGDVSIEPVQVELGSLIMNSEAGVVNLGEGVVFLPSGCNDAACAQTYTGQEPVNMDQLVVRFKLRPDLSWSDGAPLTADDSVYSFEIASNLYPGARSDLILHTQSYQALDATTVEWRGIPGYQNASYRENFFTPLPRHAWGDLAPEELFTADISSRIPIGWGPYMIDEWTAGDHISLSRNPNYFRSSEGLPAFDKLVFRFVPDKEEALAALLAGECDYLDETTALESHGPQLLELQDAGRVSVDFETGTAWEHVDFGINSLNASSPALFQSKEMRQAIAMCIDRGRMADELFFGQSKVPDSYVHPDHPLINPDIKHYAFDPQAASTLLDSIGWRDSDGDPASPRLAQGVAGVPDGTPLNFVFITTTEDEKQRAAQILKESLALCGVQVEISSYPWEELFAPGPGGPVFGRNFSMTQFGWVSALHPPCYLYTTQEIPGPYPDFPKGWGGANISGYSNFEYDQTCQRALDSLPDMPAHQAAHSQAQSIFAEDLPALPLYLRLRLVVKRPDMCNVVVDPSADSALWNLEAFNYGDGCVR